MKTIWIIFNILYVVGGESFQNGRNQGRRKFEVPDDLLVDNVVFDSPDSNVAKSLTTPFDGDFDLPQLSEWNDDDRQFGLKELILGAEAAHQIHLIHEESEVGALLVSVCRRCMVTMDVTCINKFCLLDAGFGGEPELGSDALPHAFVTGVSMHGDMLCSLCKQSRDVTCTIKLCMNPDSEKTATENGIECMQGFCRWQKETVVSTGFNNYLNAWWMPNSVYLWVDQVARELGRAYYDFLNVKSTVREALG